MNCNYIEKEIKKFCDKIDMDFQENFIREYEKIGDDPYFGGKHCGSDAENEGSRFIAGKLKEIGVPEVELLGFDTCKWQFNGAKLSLDPNLKGLDGREIKAFGYASPGTSKEGIRAQVADAGQSLLDTYDDTDVNGKIALIEGMDGLEGENATEQMQEAELHGAAAILMYMVDDVLNDEMIRVQYPRFQSHIPILAISKADALYLKKLINENDAVSMNLISDAVLDPAGGTTYNVCGTIPGKISDEHMVFTAHLDHYFKCLQDNMSSCATVLGIAKAMIDSGYQPNRTLHFVFHGSHECGPIDSKYNYISGAYHMAHELKPEWQGKTIAQINFEYTALSLDKLDVATTVGNEENVLSYNAYAPSLVGGFKEITDEIDTMKSVAATYCDLIGYMTAGIPGYTNDVMSEQISEPPTSPYCGRDHSTADNWDVYDRKALEDTGRYYGGLGIYLDQLPYMEMDYTRECTRIKYPLDEETLQALRESKVDIDTMLDALEEFRKPAEDLYKAQQELNADYLHALDDGMSEQEKKAAFEKAADLNKKTLEMFRYLHESLDKIIPLGLVYVGSQKYMETAALLMDGVEKLKKGDLKAAVSDALQNIDLAGKSLRFSKEIVDHRLRQTLAPEYAESRLWAKGLEVKTCLTLYKVMRSLNKKIKSGKTSCRWQIIKLYIAALGELKQLKKALAKETEDLKTATNKIKEMI